MISNLVEVGELVAKLWFKRFVQGWLFNVPTEGHKQMRPIMNKKEMSDIFSILHDVHIEIITGGPMIKYCQCKWVKRTGRRNELSLNYLT